MINKRSARLYCSGDISLVENYDKAAADENNTWVIHHRLETHKYKDRSRTEWIKRDEDIPSIVLKLLGLYYKRSPNELVFMTERDHRSLHWAGLQRIEDFHQKKVAGLYKRDREWLRKVSAANKLRCVGRHWFNNGSNELLVYECPEGYTSGRLPKTNQQIANSLIQYNKMRKEAST